MEERQTTERSILVHYGEIGLKGKNQPRFRRQLRRNICHKLRQTGLDWHVQDVGGLLVVTVPVEGEQGAIESVVAGLQQVFGIAWLTTAVEVPHHRFQGEWEARDFEALHAVLLESARRQVAPEKSFAVRVNRGEKSIPFTSPELERQLGGFIKEQTPWPKVNLSQPDVTFHLDFRRRSTFLFSEKLKGPGGLPVGTAGRVMALLSGGIDSPVAIYLMAKRACEVDFIHFTATTLQQEEAQQYKVARLADLLRQFTLKSRLFLVPYVYFDLALMREQVDYDLILFRRFMMRVAERLAGQHRAQALVTGDNLSQVASQTLSNLVSTSRATELPVFRPLLGYDKEEIMVLAKKIGTYETSIEPYKDCCALIARHPRTSSRHDLLVELENRLFPDYDKLIDQTLAEVICLEGS